MFNHQPNHRQAIELNSNDLLEVLHSLLCAQRILQDDKSRKGEYAQKKASEAIATVRYWLDDFLWTEAAENLAKLEETAPYELIYSGSGVPFVLD